MNALGAVLLAASGLLAGLRAAGSVRRRERSAAALCRLLELMRFELSRFRTPLPALFVSLAERTEGCAGTLCARASMALAVDGTRFRAAWAFACEPLDAAEKAVLLPLGEVLGRYGAREQEAALDAALAEMERLRDERRARAGERRRLYIGLFTAGGLLAAVLLW